MKKYISIILAVLMITSSFTFAFGTPEDVLGTDYEESVAALTSLGIINGFPDGTYRANESVTRAQMAKMLIIALGYVEIVEGYNSSFEDVQGHWAESYISLAAELEIIKGYPDGFFKPNSNVTFDEAITMAMRTLGYKDEALTGDWPANYKVKANNIGLLEKVNLSLGNADRGNVANLIYNTLNTEYGEVDVSGMFVVNSDGKKLINKVVITEDIFLEYDDVFGEDKLGSSVKLDDYVFQKVRVYKNRNDEIINVEKSLSETIMGRINNDFTSDSVRIEVEGKREYKNIPLDESVRIIYNGFYDGKDNYSGIDSGGTIDVFWQDLNDNNKIDEGEVDGIIIEKLDNKFVVTQEFHRRNFEIKGRKSYAASSYETVVIPTKENDDGKDIIDIENVIVYGDADSVEEIKKNDVLYVYSSRDGDKVSLKSVRDTITGTIEEITIDSTRDTSSAYGTVIIDEKVVSLSGYFRPYYDRYEDRWQVNEESTMAKFVPGAEVVLLLDDVGYVYGYYLLEEAAKANNEIGLVVGFKDGEIVEEENGFVGDEFNTTLPKIQILNKNGYLKIYDIEKDSDYIIEEDPVFDPSDNTTKTALTIELSYEDIIKYNLNDKSNIKSIEKVVINETFNNSEVNEEKTLVDNKYDIDDASVIFSYNEENEEWEIIEVEDLFDKVTGSAYVDDFFIDILKVDSGTYEYSERGIFAVIQSMSFTSNMDGDEIAKVRVYQDGTTKTYYTNPDNSKLFIDENNEFFELNIDDDDVIVGKNNVEEESENVQEVVKLSRLTSDLVSDRRIVFSTLDETMDEIEEDNRILTDDVVIYRLNYDGDTFESITLGSKYDLYEGSIIKAYDLSVDENNRIDVVFATSTPDVEFGSLPAFMVYDLAFDRGKGTEEDPYIIKTAAHLKNVATAPGAYFKQMSDIDLNTIDNWVPIGNSDDKFTGHYDGNGYEISNLTIDNTDNYTGLFGWIEDAEINEVTITNADVLGGDYSGILVGRTSSSLVKNCYTSGSIDAGQRVGGLIGYAYTSIVQNSSSSANVTGTSDRVGGLVGNSNKSEIDESYATGNVNGNSDRVGGLIGYAWENDVITNSYATGNVSGVEEIGGLVGYLRNGGIITNSYAIGQVSGDDRVGGLVGHSYGDNDVANVTDSYWDTETSGTTESNRGEGKTTSEMQDPSTFSTWDTDIWSLISGSYPSLQWEN